MSKDQFKEISNSKPLARVLKENEAPILVTDYAIHTDNRVGHEMGWTELGMIIKKIDGAIRSKADVDPVFKISQVKRENSAKPDYIDVQLPSFKTILETDTNGFLVLVAEDKSNVIMPKYYDFMMNKLGNVEIKGNHL